MEKHEKSENKGQLGSTDKSKSHGTAQHQQSNADQRSDNRKNPGVAMDEVRKGGSKSQPDPASKSKER